MLTVPSSAQRSKDDSLELALGQILPGPSSLETRCLLARTVARFAKAPANPVRVGRYELDRIIGVGGQGEVWRAWDPVMRRSAAIKFVRSTPRGRPRTDLRGEAQLLAGLRHPHIAEIFDIGSFEGHPYFVMEFSEGQRFDQWLEKPRTVADVVARLIEAAEALEYAHSHGVVHGDFKPQNVMVTAGSAKVLDFGLARREKDDGALRGFTRKYAAPEVVEGSPPDQSADIYAFCVTLREALIATPDDASDARNDGALAAARRVAESGSRERPEDRPRSMRAVIAQLRGRPRWRSLGVAAAGFAVVSGVLWSGLSPDDPPASPPCLVEPTALSGLWEGQETVLKHAFAEAEPTLEMDLWPGFQPLADAYVREWTEEATTACAAAQPGPARCLRRHAVRLSTWFEQWRSGDPEPVASSVWVTQGVERPSSCRTRAEVRITNLDRFDETSRLEALYELRTNVPPADAFATLLESCNREADYGCARAHLNLGYRITNDDLEGSRDHIEAAALLARQLGALHLLAEASASLATDALEGNDLAAARRWLEVIALVQQRGLTGTLRAKIECVEGAVAAEEGDYQGAIDVYTRVLERELGPRERAQTLRARAVTRLRERGRAEVELAREDLERAFELVQPFGPPRHHNLNWYYEPLASAAALNSDFEAAYEYLIASVGPKGIEGRPPYQRANLKVNLGTVLGSLERFDEAAETLYSGRADAMEFYGEEHAFVGRVDMQIAEVESFRGNHAAAAASALNAVRVAENTGGREHPEARSARWVLARVQLTHATEVCSTQDEDTCSELLSRVLANGIPEDIDAALELAAQ